MTYDPAPPRVLRAPRGSGGCGGGGVRVTRGSYGPCPNGCGCTHRRTCEFFNATLSAAALRNVFQFDGDALFAARFGRGLSKAEVARAAGINNTQYSQYENASKTCRRETLQAVAEALNVDPLSLVLATSPALNQPFGKQRYDI